MSVTELAPLAEYIAWLVATLLVIASVSIHYETMTFISDRVIPWAQKRLHNRRVMSVTIAGLMVGHIMEIWLFAVTLLIMSRFPAMGQITGDFTGRWGDFIYLSGVNYTSLGENNVRIIGPMRAISVTSTLTGMMMIAWSASFTYLKMEQLWKRRGP